MRSTRYAGDSMYPVCPCRWSGSTVIPGWRANHVPAMLRSMGPEWSPSRMVERPRMRPSSSGTGIDA